MSTELAITTAAHGSSIYRDREKIETIKQTVAKGATDAQLEMFLTLCERYQLDPFLKEIWFVPSVGVMTARDGYLKVALRDPDYDGIASAAVCEGDTFEIDPIAPTVRHSFGAKRGQIIGAYAVVFHKQRRPAVCFAPFAEYQKSGNVWATYKSAMICKVAEVLALKRQFGISGLITEEEIGNEPAPESTRKRSSTTTAPRQNEDVIDVDPETAKPWQTRAEMKQVFADLAKACEQRGMTAAYIATLKDFGVEDPSKFTDANKALDCYAAIYSRLQHHGSPAEAA